MRVYVWKRLDGLTDNWHDEGGAVVIAEDVKEARALLPSDYSPKNAPPDLELAVDSAATYVFIFPDAGCC